MTWIVCKAHRTNGEPCKAPAIRGGTVCVVHGGAAPQVRERAARRLVELAWPAAVRLGKLIDNRSPAIALAAANSVLDRNGLKAIDQVAIDQVVTVEYVERALPAAPRVLEAGQ